MKYMSKCNNYYGTVVATVFIYIFYILQIPNNKQERILKNQNKHLYIYMSVFVFLFSFHFCGSKKLLKSRAFN